MFVNSPMLNALVDIGAIVCLTLGFGLGWAFGYAAGHWRGRHGVKK